MQIVGGQSIYLHKCHISSFVQLTKLVSNNTYVETLRNLKKLILLSIHTSKADFKQLLKGLTLLGALYVSSVEFDET